MFRNWVVASASVRAQMGIWGPPGDGQDSVYFMMRDARENVELHDQGNTFFYGNSDSGSDRGRTVYASSVDPLESDHDEDSDPWDSWSPHTDDQIEKMYQDIGSDPWRNWSLHTDHEITRMYIGMGPGHDTESDDDSEESDDDTSSFMV